MIGCLLDNDIPKLLRCTVFVVEHHINFTGHDDRVVDCSRPNALGLLTGTPRVGASLASFIIRSGVMSSFHLPAGAADLDNAEHRAVIGRI